MPNSRKVNKGKDNRTLLLYITFNSGYQTNWSQILILFFSQEGFLSPLKTFITWLIYLYDMGLSTA
jgi:hypothetical protein